jgi:hypothetical protein
MVERDVKWSRKDSSDLPLTTNLLPDAQRTYLERPVL